jgi:aerotaxis receptor
MSHALSEELLHRDAALDRSPDTSILRFRQMQDAADGLTELTDDLILEFGRSAIIPHNMRVIASRLETNGGPISTLSANYGEMSRQMSGWFEVNVVGVNSNFSRIKDTVSQSLFMKCMSRILNECATQLNSERRILGEIDLETEKLLINKLSSDYSNRSEVGQNQVAEEAYRILDACKTMNRHVLGLSTSRVMCKIESARLMEGRESLSDTIEELNEFQERIRARLLRIEELSGEIRTLLG